MKHPPFNARGPVAMSAASAARRSIPLLAALASAALRASDAHAVRVWEEPREGWRPPAPANGLSASAPSGLGALLEMAVLGSAASPDLRPPSFTPPLAAGGHVGASRFPEGVAERWLDIGFFAQPQFIAQTGYDFASTSNFSVPPGVNMQRTRIVLHGQAHPLLQMRVEFNLSDRLELLDTYALVPVRRWLQIQIGQFRVPFSRQELVSSSRYQFADRALWAGGANSSGVRFIPSFDLGVMVWGWTGPKDIIEYYAGIFNGKGANSPFNLDGFFLYAGRVAVNPLGRPSSLQESAVNLGHAPTLAIGFNAAGQIRQVGTITRPGSMMPEPNRIGAISLGADVFFAAYGASFYGELYARDTNETDTTVSPSTQAFGWLAQAGYFIPVGYLANRLELVARIQGFDPSACITRQQGTLVMGAPPPECTVRLPASPTREVYRDFMKTMAITFGVNWYQLGHGFKIQAAYTINNEYRDLAGGAPDSGIVLNDVFTLQLTGSF